MAGCTPQHVDAVSPTFFFFLISLISALRTGTMKCRHRRAPDVSRRCALPLFKPSTDVKVSAGLRLSKGPL